MSTSRLKQISKVIRNPKVLLSRVVMLPLLNKRLSDITYLKWVYYLRTGKHLNIEHPHSFNEKIQWLKLHNTSDECTRAVDKYEVRQIIADKIGEEYLIPVLGCWESFDEIDFKQLPNQFVLKCTHDSGSVVLCKDKSKFKIRAAKSKLEKAMKHNFFWTGREYPYKNVKPRIICEKLMKDEKSEDLVDYKFLCFNGQPKILFYGSERFTSKDGVAKFDFYDMDLNHLPIKSVGHENSSTPPTISADCFDKMKELCCILSAGYPHIRVDFYVINGKIYFGELTFHHDGGFVQLQPEKWNDILGEWIKLPIDNITDYENTN